jgi:hypothetical protein
MTRYDAVQKALLIVTELIRSGHYNATATRNAATVLADVNSLADGFQKVDDVNR